MGKEARTCTHIEEGLKMMLARAPCNGKRTNREGKKKKKKERKFAEMETREKERILSPRCLPSMPLMQM
jgi:hypothetical protein